MRNFTAVITPFDDQFHVKVTVKNVRFWFFAKTRAEALNRAIFESQLV